MPLKDSKDYYPIQVAEYAVAVGIANEPALTWWVKDTLFARNRYIDKIKSRYRNVTHKFGS